MKRPHLLRVESPAETFAPLFAAAQAAGVRLGWLEFAADPTPVPPNLAAAADLGALRAVAVGEGRTLSLKPRRGAPVLDDVLREHFLGTAAVLVHGDVEAPRLRASAEGEWRIETADGGGGEWTAEALVARLRRPRPW